MTEEQARQRFRVQKPAEFYEARGDFVIEGTGDNSGRLEEAAQELKGR